jgi:hypothetical protein
VTFRPEYLTYDDVRAAADRFLREYHLKGTRPVPIEEIVEFDLSMDVIPLEGLKAHVGVDAFLTSDVGTIYVDEWVVKHAPVRYRFSLAHEVAHYWLHDALYQGCSIHSVRDWAEIQAAIGEENYKWFEWQANSFAGLVLVPGGPLKPDFQLVADRLISGGIEHRQIDHHPTRAALVRELAKQFVVSEQTMEIRLEHDGLLAKVTPDLLQKRV